MPKSFLLFTDYEEKLSILSNEELGKILRAIFYYLRTATVPKMSKELNIVFNIIKIDLDKNREKYDKKVALMIENKAKNRNHKKSNRNHKVSQEITCDNEKHTIIYINTIINIINYLNNKLSTNYKNNSNKTKSLITARLNEGFTEEDFYSVIDKKYNEWNNTDYAKFLRPETLFSNKFEGYLNQVENKKTLKDISFKDLGEDL